MLKRFIALSGVLFMLLVISACEEVIEFELSDAEEAIVIEGIITGSKEPFKVFVSKTTPYFGAPKSNPVSGAIVRMRTEKGSLRYFEERSPGVYELEKIIAQPGAWYILEVQYDSITYTARSFMNELVKIEEIGFSHFDGFGIFDSGYKATTYIKDPVNVENYYRLKYYVNGQPTRDQGGITLYSDHLFDGKVIGLAQRSIVFQKTDTLTIELQSIDKAAYDYFSTLENIVGIDIQHSASPANPISNFNNGALGYFSAHTFDHRTVIIKDYIGD